MYTSYFGLKEKPFSITPDPRYLYLSERHAEALAHLLYGVTESGGFIQLTGEVGTGKTTLVRSMLEQLPTHVDVALILNPRLSANEFLAAICHEIHADVQNDSSPREMVNALNTKLLEAHGEGRRVVLIVDEAQNLSADVLEQVRLLTNLETAKQKLLQIILIGQPELRELLGRNDLRQLAQRITGRYHLDPLVRSESIEYLRHRLQVAGAGGEIFKPNALKTVHGLAGGVPRLMNVIADRALLGAYSNERKLVTPALVRAAAAEVLGVTYKPRWRPWVGAGAAIAATAVIGVGLTQAYRLWRDTPPAAIGYGGMLGEGSLALASVMAAAAGIALVGSCDLGGVAVENLSWSVYYDNWGNSSSRTSQAFVLGGGADRDARHQQVHRDDVDGGPRDLLRGDHARHGGADPTVRDHRDRRRDRYPRVDQPLPRDGRGDSPRRRTGAAAGGEPGPTRDDDRGRSGSVADFRCEQPDARGADADGARAVLLGPQAAGRGASRADAVRHGCRRNFLVRQAQRLPRAEQLAARYRRSHPADDDGVDAGRGARGLRAPTPGQLTGPRFFRSPTEPQARQRPSKLRSQVMLSCLLSQIVGFRARPTQATGR